MAATWYVDIRISKNGEFVEYKGSDVVTDDRATAAAVEKHVVDKLINHSPAFKGGRVTQRVVRKLPK
ncbi:hypothetical protein ACWD3J_13995 [Streptomyces sp. NPDC002755]